MKFMSVNSYRYGYQGEYAEDETDQTGIKANTFQLRLYDARIGRWMSPDPYGQYHSPYLAMGNSPTSQVDPDGGRANPVYNSLGEYLGDTKEGFVGKPIIFDGGCGVRNLSEYSAGDLVANGGKYMGNMLSDLKLSSLSNIYTHIISKVDGVDVSALRNGLISVRRPHGEDSFETFNNPNMESSGLMNYKAGTNIVSINLDVYPQYYETTVENIQNSLGVHEFISHFKNGIKGGITSNHWMAPFNQMDHPTFENTTLKFKSKVHGTAAYLYFYGTGKYLSQSIMGDRMKPIYLENMTNGFKKFYK